MRAAAAALTMLAFALPGHGEAARRAELRLKSLEPLVVSGVAFGRSELVRLTATVPGRPLRRSVVLASDKGTFVALFPLVLDRCTRFTVRATGARGSRAVLQATPRCTKRPKPGPRPKGSGKKLGAVGLGHLAVVERLVEDAVVDALLARDLPQRAA